MSEEHSALIARLEAVAEKLESLSVDHEDRLRVLESFRWQILGGAVVAGAVFAAIQKVL